jgi:hypothetical protein
MFIHEVQYATTSKQAKPATPANRGSGADTGRAAEDSNRH